MTLFSVSRLATCTPAASAGVGTGAYRGWWWFYSPPTEEA
jgi:hypothetical protein